MANVEDMKNELTVPQEESTDLVLSPEEEARALLEESQKGSHAILKFKDGYFHVRDVKVPLGTRYFAHPGNWERQWVRFDDKQVTDRIRVKVSTKKLLPARNKLSNPELEDVEGDPWTLQNVIPFENVESGNLEVFTTQTAGGKMAIEGLAKAYAKAVLAGTARGLPIIELQGSTFRTSHGKDQPMPIFPIVDWENPVASAPAEQTTVIPPEPKTSSPNENDMDDEIPF